LNELRHFSIFSCSRSGMLTVTFFAMILPLASNTYYIFDTYRVRMEVSKGKGGGEGTGQGSAVIREEKGASKEAGRISGFFSGVIQYAAGRVSCLIRSWLSGAPLSVNSRGISGGQGRLTNLEKRVSCE
jgi:hypothetical protein